MHIIGPCGSYDNRPSYRPLQSSTNSTQLTMRCLSTCESAPLMCTRSVVRELCCITRYLQAFTGSSRPQHRKLPFAQILVSSWSCTYQLVITFTSLNFSQNQNTSHTHLFTKFDQYKSVQF